MDTDFTYGWSEHTDLDITKITEDHLVARLAFVCVKLEHIKSKLAAIRRAVAPQRFPDRENRNFRL